MLLDELIAMYPWSSVRMRILRERDERARLGNGMRFAQLGLWCLRVAVRAAKVMIPVVQSGCS